MDNVEKIIVWLNKVYGGRSAVIAISGGVDSALTLTLLVRALGREHVIPVCLPYKDQDMYDAKKIIEWNGVTEMMLEINIKEAVDEMARKLDVENEVVRKGNIMARIRMIALFDTAKRVGGLVCGTENKSEHELGYYTRFGDGASDVEPIVHLYKTEVWEMAEKLGLPKVFYTKVPTAGLWEGQSDEEEMGFSYIDADKVLRGEIEGVDKEVVARVKEMVKRNGFKQEVPYTME